MKTEENVGGRGIAPTEHSAKAEKEKGSSVLGKFRSVDALAEAYSSLQAEFTRRSQRLKELEKKAENSEKLAALSYGAEKLRKTESAEKETEAGRSENPLSVSSELKEPDSYTEGQEPALPSPPEGTPDSAAASLRDKAQNGERAETVFPFPDVPSAGETPVLSEKDLYEAVSRSEGVRLKVIGDYLSSLKSAEAPLMRGGTGTLAVPPAKPASISEAGDMALRYFKKEKQA